MAKSMMRKDGENEDAMRYVKKVEEVLPPAIDKSCKSD